MEVEDFTRDILYEEKRLFVDQHNKPAEFKSKHLKTTLEETPKLELKQLPSSIEYA